MGMMDNYPDGTWAGDPSAPWNDKTPDYEEPQEPEEEEEEEEMTVDEAVSSLLRCAGKLPLDYLSTAEALMKAAIVVVTSIPVRYKLVQKSDVEVLHSLLNLVIDAYGGEGDGE